MWVDVFVPPLTFLPGHSNNLLQLHMPQERILNYNISISYLFQQFNYLLTWNCFCPDGVLGPLFTRMEWKV